MTARARWRHDDAPPREIARPTGVKIAKSYLLECGDAPGSPDLDRDTRVSNSEVDVGERRALINEVRILEHKSQILRPEVSKLT